MKTKAQKLAINTKNLPWQRKRPICYEDGKATAEFVSEPEDYYRRIYYEYM